MKIALFGAYGQGNFGDDLMAVQTGRHLLQQGHEVTVFDLPEKIAHGEGLRATNSVAELMQGAHCMVYAGGGALLTVPGPRPAWLARIHQSTYDVARLCRLRNVPVAVISIGSHGGVNSGNIPPPMAFLYGTGLVKLTTLRLQVDQPCLKDLGCDALCFPDMVLNSVSLLGQPPPPSTGTSLRRVGLNILNNDENLSFARFVVWIAKIRKTFTVSLLSTHLEESGHNYELMHIPGYSPLPQISYVDPAQMLHDTGSSLDLLISGKLHLGISMLSLGKRFCSYRGQGKVAASLKGLGMGECIINSRKKLLQGLWSGELFNLPLLDPQVRKESHKHLEELDRFLVNL